MAGLEQAPENTHLKIIGLEKVPETTELESTGHEQVNKSTQLETTGQLGTTESDKVPETIDLETTWKFAQILLIFWCQKFRHSVQQKKALYDLWVHHSLAQCMYLYYRGWHIPLGADAWGGEKFDQKLCVLWNPVSDG